MNLGKWRFGVYWAGFLGLSSVLIWVFSASTAQKVAQPIGVEPGESPSRLVEPHHQLETVTEPTPRAIHLARVLARVLEEEGIRPQDLNSRFIENGLTHEGVEAVLRDLPPRVAQAYRDYLESIGGLSSVQDRPEDSKPAWMNRYIAKLESIPTSAEVDQFVHQVAESEEVLEGDFEQLAQLCGGSRGCIEKSIYLWMKANHQFEDGMLEAAIERYL